MKKTFIALLSLIICMKASPQAVKDGNTHLFPGDPEEYTASTPPYGLDKVEKLVTQLSREYGSSTALAPNVYTSLSLREKFTYNMIHAESYRQICSLSLIREPNKLYAELPRLSEYGLSQRQMDFFKDNRDSVIVLMSECIGEDRRVGLNFKNVIIDIHATEMIPLLLATYKIGKKDHDILTVLMWLMIDGKYQPFMTSVPYKKLHNSSESYYERSIDLDVGVEALILRYASDYAAVHHKKA
jgi:hypothetical protein